MTLFEIIIAIITLVFGSGCFYSLITLKATRAKANEDVNGAKLDNATKLLELNKTYVVEPVTNKLDVLTKNIKKLERAVSKANNCIHTDNCPVKHELQKHEADNNE